MTTPQQPDDGPRPMDALLAVDSPHHGIPRTLADLAVPVDALRPYGRNPRRGDVALIAESLAAHGQYRPVVVRTGTGEVLAGNHTVAAARSLGWTHVAATWVDVDDDAAARIVLVDNRANDVAAYDDGDLAELLCGLAATGGTADHGDPFHGTGFAADDLTALLSRIAASVDLPPDLLDPTTAGFSPVDAAHRLDRLAPRPCQRCGYDVANDPDGLTDAPTDPA